MSDDSGPTNRLATSSSPYLLLHQHNPVDWYPWGREALDRAREEDKPIFISVGYSTCYWCHVMERESFSDQGTADLMNREFINIKLDREERPDLDEIYMSATQILTGHGGWPNSVFLTPSLEPFFAGTYFPPADRPGLPSFRNVLRSMSDAWRSRRTEVEEQARSVTGGIRHYLGDRPGPSPSLPEPEVAQRSFEALARSFDPEWGGFGAEPKFPSPANLLLLEELASEQLQAMDMLVATLDHMARGGIFDQVGGGFHRYATDREWNIPHFEKMLYDNGWLLELYAREYGRSGDPEAARVVRATAGFLARELTSPEGAFWSALDAETNGEEGAFYVWNRQDLLGVLGEEDFGFLGPIYGFDGAPFFEGESYVLHLPERLERQAERRRMEPGELLEQLESLRRKLLHVRGARRRPLTDDKVLTDWNGAAISGLAEAGRLLGEQSFLAQASGAADFVLSELRPRGGPLLHAWRDGVAHTPALLADYAFFIRGLLALFAATGESRWLEAAIELSAEQEARLADPEGGYFIAPEGDDLLVRSRDLFDGAMPAPNAISVLNLLQLSSLDPGGTWGESARRALRAFAPVMERVPEATRTLSVAARRVAPGGDDAVVAGGENASDPTAERSDRSEVPPETSSGDQSGGQSGGQSGRQSGNQTGGLSSSGEVVTGAIRIEKGGREGGFSLALTIADGWHVSAPAEAPHESGNDRGPWEVLPLGVEGRDAEIVDLAFPRPVSSLEGLAGSGGVEALPVYSGAVEVTGTARATGARPRVVVSFQVCDDRRCLAPAELVFELARPAG